METLIDEVVERVRVGLERIAAEHASAGEGLGDVGDAAALSARMLAPLTVSRAVAEHVGPVMRPGAVLALLGISKQALAERTRRRTIVAVRTSDDRWLYPAKQFTRRGRVLPALGRVLAELEPEPGLVTDVTMAAWLSSPKPALGGDDVYGWLRSGGDVETVVALARAAARRWAA